MTDEAMTDEELMAVSENHVSRQDIGRGLVCGSWGRSWEGELFHQSLSAAIKGSTPAEEAACLLTYIGELLVPISRLATLQIKKIEEAEEAERQKERAERRKSVEKLYDRIGSLFSPDGEASTKLQQRVVYGLQCKLSDYVKYNIKSPLVVVRDLMSKPPTEWSHDELMGLHSIGPKTATAFIKELGERL